MLCLALLVKLTFLSLRCNCCNGGLFLDLCETLIRFGLIFMANGIGAETWLALVLQRGYDSGSTQTLYSSQ